MVFRVEMYILIFGYHDPWMYGAGCCGKDSVRKPLNYTDKALVAFREAKLGSDKFG